MKLYDATTPNTLRVQVFLAEKGIEVSQEVIDVMGGGTRTPEFLDMNSLGELPVLQLDDGRILTESVAICRYFEELYPTPRLMGESAYEQGLIEMWNRRMELHIFGPLGDAARHTFAFFADRVEQNPDYAAAQMRAFDRAWAWLDRELADGRPFIAGNSLTIADITGMAALFVCDLMNKTLPEELKRTKRWEKEIRCRPSLAERMPEAA